MNNLIVKLFLFLSVSLFFTGCGKSAIKVVPAKQVEPVLEEKKKSAVFEFEGPIWIDVVRGQFPMYGFSDRDVIPATTTAAIGVQSANEIRYPADGVAFKEEPDPYEPWFAMLPRGRKLTVRIPFESDWAKIDSISHYSLELSFPKA